MAAEPQTPATDEQQTQSAPGVLSGESQTEFVEISFDEDATSVDWSETWKAIRFYALPLISFVVFVGLILFTVIPNIQRIFTTIDEINVLREEDEAVNERIERLIALRAEQLTRQQIISKINEIVPTGTSEVVAFRQRVIDTAEFRAVNLDSSLLGEDLIDQNPNEAEVTEGLILIEIPSEFGFSGTFDGFRSFLNDLYQGEDFFIVREMSLNLIEEDDGSSSWGAQLDLVKYQFFVDEGVDLDGIYTRISEQVVPNQFVIDFLENRFLNGGSFFDGDSSDLDFTQPTITGTPVSFPEDEVLQ
ncbi:MAG: hypothetical protein TR69_WS6001000574 [candidate division WS6 bacterium OLB20]|uniref:Uncharacterized protein n=1 Tax=candidate division WS6 bacterium OLB20 TaxID=1617426 RepID=A0A136LY29_9BACT|nr:MAG: hypothetical protein TR69_WS6001000574 [candidate division WS6 bacterium OLB20]